MQSHLPGLLAEYTGLGASSFLVTFLSLPIKPAGQLMPVIDRDERSVHKLSVVEDLRPSCWPQIEIECRALGLAIDGDGQPSPTQASTSDGTAT